MYIEFSVFYIIYYPCVRTPPFTFHFCATHVFFHFSFDNHSFFCSSTVLVLQAAPQLGSVDFLCSLDIVSESCL